MDGKKISLYIDLVFCLIILPLLVMLLPIERWLNIDPTYVTMLFVWLYATYILHRALTVPMLFGDKRRYLLVVLLFAGSLIMTYMLSRYEMSLPEHIARRMQDRPAPRVRPVNPMEQQAVWFLYSVVTMFSVVVALFRELNRQIIERQSVEFEKKRAELSLYKAQINPHFLFNTLNALLGLVVTKSDRAEEAIVQFTSLMRYMSFSSTEESVPIHTEVEYIEEYIELQRLRLSEHTDVEFTTSTDTQSASCRISPMLLITFVENALKYGVSSSEDSTIEIGCRVEDGVLSLTTRNKIFKTQSVEKGAGIGIDNCRKRLELLYPGRYKLHVVENDYYEVDLMIRLKG